MLSALLCIGHELIYGRVVNENAKVAGEALQAYGFKLGEVVVVPDDIPLIVKALKRLVDEYDFIIVSGGLGPTDDDLTVLAASQAFDLELEERAEVLLALQKNREYAKSFEVARKLALLPKGSILLSQDLTMAGFKLLVKEKPIFFLPGVPSQFEALLKNKVLPELLNIKAEVRSELAILKFFDLNETDLNSFLQNTLGDEIKELEIGYYPEGPEVKLILQASILSSRASNLSSQASLLSSREKRGVPHQKSLIEKVKEMLKERFKFEFLSEGDKTLPVLVGELLLEKGKRVAVAESCTGGQLASLITSISGSSNYFDRGFVVYSERSKVEVLGVSEETIAKHTVYSHETALEMAKRTLEKSKADYSLATTGLAGPTGGTDDLPVGTVFIALGTGSKAISVRFKFSGGRNWVQKLASYTALDMLRRYLVYGEGLSRYRFALELKERTF
ncbi:MAG: nicotinamide-nucleotide amidohydrolase family protein [Caldimicrobium sp.]|jgi:nicotinamide-nucleotide amidase|nr:nicotinamide-nucleotide amidohydrolase family protein [Caldimicrobium sp.]